ncbi:isochorismatase family protein [Paraglaciecola polaris]|uniref:Isochorismatase hydrolase n=1 Tax=Paraglaciecola polaris LMG 21857 TaxID=1129793 RepID=K6Z6T2_9ALTE|nr:isochorismatase family protein [Paraglaciecola polaris]GAC31886.1 isochorismatase hydrolase [Paraglaciecola polaris LMG 21857]
MLTIQNTGLVVVDIQGDLAHMVYESDTLIHNTLMLIKAAKVLELPIIYLEQAPLKLGKTVITLSEELSPRSPITKHTFNACAAPEFLDALKQHTKQNWLVCGIEAHICVYQSVLGMLNLGYSVDVVCDATSSRLAENKTLAINKLSRQGAAMTSVEMALYELVGDSRTPAFKAILPLIK